MQPGQKGNNFCNGVQNVTTDHNIGVEIGRGVLPGRLQKGDVGQPLFLSVSAQEVQHATIRLNGDYLLHEWGKRQGKPTCASANIQHAHRRSELATYPEEEGIPG